MRKTTILLPLTAFHADISSFTLSWCKTLLVVCTHKTWRTTHILVPNAVYGNKTIVLATCFFRSPSVLFCFVNKQKSHIPILFVHHLSHLPHHHINMGGKTCPERWCYYPSLHLVPNISGANNSFTHSWCKVLLAVCTKEKLALNCVRYQ